MASGNLYSMKLYWLFSWIFWKLWNRCRNCKQPYTSFDVMQELWLTDVTWSEWRHDFRLPDVTRLIIIKTWRVTSDSGGDAHPVPWRELSSVLSFPLCPSIFRGCVSGPDSGPKISNEGKIVNGWNLESRKIPVASLAISRLNKSPEQYI